MAAGYALSAAFELRPEGPDRREVQAKVDAGTKGIDGKVRLTAADDQFKAALARSKMDVNDLARKLGSLRVTADGRPAQLEIDKLGLSADRLQRKLASEKLTIEGLAKATLELQGLSLKADQVARKLSGTGSAAKSAESDLVGLGGVIGKLGNFTMPALIAAAVALSPELVTVGGGLGAFGLAAFGVLKPLEEASAKTGGLQANLSTLPPSLRGAAHELIGLQSEFHDFSASVQPEVLRAFGSAVRLAGGLLRDFQPVAKAAGSALDQVLTSVAQDFQSGEWQQFFQFIARNAGPDIRQLGGLFTDLLNVIPPLIEALHPLASAIIRITDTAVNAAHALFLMQGSMTGLADASTRTAFVTQVTGKHLDTFAKIGYGTQGVLDLLTGNTKAAGRQFASMSGSIKATGDSSGAAIPLYAGLDSVIAASNRHAEKAATNLNNVASAITAIYNAESKSLQTQLDYSNALITQRNDAKNLSAALKVSHDRIGLATTAQRNSFSAANTYISDLIQTAAKARASGQGIGAQITSIQQALPMLRNVRGGTKQYWQEVQTLVNWLHRLQNLQTIHRNVIVHGDGTFSIKGPGGIPYPVKAAAAGGYISMGSGPRADDVPAMLSKGELVVPAHMVAAGAVDHLRGKLPGFAAGGSVTPHLETATRGFLQSFNTDFDQAMAKAITAASKAAAAAFAAAGGPVSASARQAQAYARSRLAAYGWGAAQMPPLISLWQGESSWNRLARNPSSGAYGIPQALPPSKMGAAANPPKSSAGAQINWGLGYIKSVYGSPSAAYAAWSRRSPHWYAEGGLVTLGRALAHYPHRGKPLDEQIAALAGQHHRDVLLSRARGLPAGTRRHYAQAAAKLGVHLAALRHERNALTAYEDHLRGLDAGYNATLRAAKHAHLTAEAKRLRGYLAHNEKIVKEIARRVAGARKKPTPAAGSSDGTSGASSDGTSTPAPPPPLTVEDVFADFARYLPVLGPSASPAGEGVTYSGPSLPATASVVTPSHYWPTERPPDWPPPGLLSSAARPVPPRPASGYSETRMANIEAFLDRLVRLTSAAPDQHADALARALNRVAHRSALASKYSTRRG